MFSGYISDVGCLKNIQKKHKSFTYYIETQYSELERGESIAVDGICLTVTECGPNYFYCDLSPETLACTKAAHLVKGDRVNLERSLRLNDRLHGHLVTGHIDQVCYVKQKQPHEDFTVLCFDGIQETAQAFLVAKGSIAVNGVSLTINLVSPGSFEVMLIPETLAKTNLRDLEIGDSVNIEYDYLAKLIARQCHHYLEQLNTRKNP